MVTTRIGEDNHPRPSVSTLYRCIPIPLRQWLSSTPRAVNKQLKHSPLLLFALRPSCRTPLCGLVRTWRLDSLRRLWDLTLRSFLLFFVACRVASGKGDRQRANIIPLLPDCHSSFFCVHHPARYGRIIHGRFFLLLHDMAKPSASLQRSCLYRLVCASPFIGVSCFFIGMVPEGLNSFVGYFSCWNKLELYKSF